MSKVLVAYFSPTGVTAQQAKIIADATGGDLFEIRPEEPYTSEDLDWQNEKARSVVEQNDSSARPAIAEMPRIYNYDTVFLGHPLWWYRAPKIMCTFVEQADLSGRTVVDFSTCGSKPTGNPSAELAALAGDDVNWIEGRTFVGASPTEVTDWVKSLDL